MKQPEYAIPKIFGDTTIFVISETRKKCGGFVKDSLELARFRGFLSYRFA